MASLSSSTTSLPPSWPSESNSTSLRDASFSSYLNSSEETYIRTLVHSTQNLTPIHHNPRQSKGAVSDETEEIDVFSADKYFNGEGRPQDKKLSITRSPPPPPPQVIRIDDDEYRMRQNKYQTRPASSYSDTSSSWNSQSALLRRVQQRTPSRSNSNNKNYNYNSKMQGKRSSFLPCCSCSDKSSVDVEDELSSNSTTRGRRRGGNKSVKSIKPTTSLEASEITRMNKLRLDRERQPSDPFVFPSVSDSAVHKIHSDDQELEVFGSSTTDNILDDHGIVERSLSMLSWDAIPRQQQSSVDQEMITTTESYRDSESDASSDLFEIECLSCTANPVVAGGPRQQPSESGCTSPPTTCYAPSEASIEWSVVTASAADFSTISDSEDQRSGITSVSRRKLVAPKMSTSSSYNKKPAINLGCKSQKAVRVAGEVYRVPIGNGRERFERERRQRSSDSLTNSMTRFQAEAKLAGFGQKLPRKEAGAVIAQQPPPRWSHSSHASDLLYIQ